MTFLLTWSVTIIYLTTLIKSQCPQGRLCSECYQVYNQVFEFSCSVEKTPIQPTFIIRYNPLKWMDIICDHEPKWSDFHLGEIKQASFIESISFKLCQLSDTKTISEIIRQIFKEDVKELDFQSYMNLTTTFRRETFSNLNAIERLGLSNNNLFEVPVDLLHDLANLKYLNMSWNLLKELPTGFLDLPNLEYVYLSHNQLETMESGTFKGLSKLKVLNLEFNKLTSLAPAIFDDLQSLAYLNIGQNDLEKLSNNVFEQLKALKIIHLGRNNLTDEGIPRNLFRNKRLLEIVTFNDNKRPLYSLPAGTFSDIKNLVSVDLDGNGLVEIPKNLFAGASRLKNISLDRNKLAEIPEELFKDCKEIQLLSLRDNEITDLPSNMFAFMSKLEILDLGYNKLKEFNNKILDGLTSLRILSLANNHIERIREDGKCTSLNNFLNSSPLLISTRSKDYLRVKNVQEMSSCSRNIEYVFLSNNRLETLSSRWLYSESLNILTLHNNRIKNITMNDFKFYSGDVQITYTGNQITTISFDDLRFRTSSLKLWLGSNPMNCDCRLHDLLLHHHGKLGSYLGDTLTVDMNKLTCNEPRELKGILVKDLSRMALKCLVTDPTTINATCPEKCQCWTRPEDQAYLIDCSYRILREAPQSLQSPKGYHIELNLTGNVITKMPSMMQPGYHNVTKLILSDNLISSINLNPPSDNLEVLALDKNKLTKLEPMFLDSLTNLTKLTQLELGNNPWTCNCEIVDFVKFIHVNVQKFPSLQAVTCASSDDPIFQTTPEDICPAFIGSIIFIVSILAIIGIFIGTIIVLIYYYQHEIKVWIYARNWCPWFISNIELHKDKYYDAFISFSDADENFVADTLVPTLEEGPYPYRLCMNYRHWIPNQPVSKQIVHSVQDSKRTIIVLSPYFLQNIWSSGELRAAHKQVLGEKRSRVIIILYGEIGLRDFDPKLKSYVMQNTCIKWGEPWFWEKLKYALPHRHNWRKKSKMEMVDLLDHKVPSLNN